MWTMVLNSLLLLVSILLLWKGSDWLVESAARIGRKYKISDLTIGLTIVAFGTSAPEFAVTVSAALSAKADISVGNIVGSNIFNLGFILGGAVLFRALKTSRTLVYRDGMLLIATSLVLVAMLYDHHLARWEGILLFSGLIGYLLLLALTSKSRDLAEIEGEIPEGQATWRDAPLLLIGIGFVVGGGHLLVVSASEIARTMGVSEWVIAVTIVAAGTSAPEFATSLMAAAKGHHGMSLGNLVGSDLFNLLGVLGLAGIIRPMDVVPSSFNSVLMLMGMCVLTVVFMRMGWKLTRWKGGVLLGIGLARWILDFMQ